MKPATIVGYDVLMDYTIAQLVLRVNDHLRDGWQPTGPVQAYWDHDNNFTFFQTITLNDSVPRQPTNT